MAADYRNVGLLGPPMESCFTRCGFRAPRLDSRGVASIDRSHTISFFPVHNARHAFDTEEKVESEMIECQIYSQKFSFLFLLSLLQMDAICNVCKHIRNSKQTF